jgi:ABC-type glycerol-3-phosphate transport system permease component
LDWPSGRIFSRVPRRAAQVEAIFRKFFIARCAHSSFIYFFQLFIPFSLAILFLVSHQYELDPILVFFGQSETTPFRTLSIREPYVKKLLMGRAIWVSVLVTVFVTALTMLFWAVPGHRL